MVTVVNLSEILLATICFLIFRCLSNSTNGLPRNWPLVGMLPTLLLQIHRAHDWSTEVLERSQCTFLFKGPRFSNMNILVTADPSNIHYIMSSNFPNFPKGPEFKKIFDVLGDGIFNSDLELWRNQRKIAQSLINHQLFYQFLVKTSKDKVEKGLIPVLDHVTKRGLVVDLQDLFQRFTFDVTCLIVTGHDPGCLSEEFPEVAFAKAMDNAEEAIFYRHVVPESVWKFQKWLKVGEERKLSEAWGTLDHVIAEIISAKRKELSKRKNIIEDGHGIDLLTSYMSFEEADDMMKDEFLRDTIMNFMLAGRDTTSSALSWFFWLLSRNPGVEAKIRAELKATLPATEAEKWRLFDIEEIKGLVYLHGALCESLRLYPPVPFQHKSPLQRDTLPSGHHVTPRMKILFSLYAMGRMTSIWGKDCLEFKPERWISGRGGIKHQPSYKFLAFNAGPRTCLGREVAFTQMKVVAAAIIYNYNVEVLDGHTVTPSMSIILHMKHGMNVELSKRWA